MNTFLIFGLLNCLFFLQSCSVDDSFEDQHWIPEIPEVTDHEVTEETIFLGRMLFYDPVLSRDSSLSCATCHLQEHAFTDGLPQAIGIEGRQVSRNSPTIANIAYHPYFNRDGGVANLEMQILVPIQEHSEFDHNIVDIILKLNTIPKYQEQFGKAWNDTATTFSMTRSIADFERTLISGNSPFDQWYYGQDQSVVSQQVKEGFSLFQELNCSQCHSGFDFSDYTFQNNGIYQEYADSGRMRITGNEVDRGKFKVMTLRNVEMTGPYMHDGSFTTLEEVIDHYETGGENHWNQSSIIQPLEISEYEKESLLLFLKSLTDVSFIENDAYKNPFP